MAKQRHRREPFMETSNVEDDCTTTEEMSSEERMEDIDYNSLEANVRDSIESWLSLHGPKLFAFESSKFLAAEKKREMAKQNSRK